MIRYKIYKIADSYYSLYIKNPWYMSDKRITKAYSVEKLLNIIKDRHVSGDKIQIKIKV